MKKIVLAVMAVAAIGFTSCNNKANKDNPAIDSTSLVENMSPAELAGLDADNLIKDLTEKIAANNPEAVQAVIEKAKEKIAELLARGDQEAAKIYQEKISTFLTENAEKIKAVVGEENAAVSSLITAITTAPVDVANAAEGAVNAVEGAAEDLKNDAKKKVDETVDAQKKKAGEAIDDAAADAKKKLGL